MCGAFPQIASACTELLGGVVTFCNALDIADKGGLTNTVCGPPPAFATREIFVTAFGQIRSSDSGSSVEFIDILPTGEPKTFYFGTFQISQDEYALAPPQPTPVCTRAPYRGQEIPPIYPPCNPVDYPIAAAMDAGGDPWGYVIGESETISLASGFASEFDQCCGISGGAIGVRFNSETNLCQAYLSSEERTGSLPDNQQCGQGVRNLKALQAWVVEDGGPWQYSVSLCGGFSA